MISEKIGFFGAGFSKWCIDLPLMKDLFDFSGNYWSREKKRIDKLKKIYADWKSKDKSENNELFITEILDPQNIRFFGGLNKKNETYSNLLIFYLGRRLIEPFIWYEYHLGEKRRHTYNIQGARKRRIPFLNRPDGWLTKLNALLTTNYDMTLEYLLDIKEYNYGFEGETLNGRGDYPVSQYKNPVILSGSIPLLKLHGSLSWTSEGHHTNGRGGITGKAEIIPPKFEKFPSSKFQKIWTQAKNRLKNAKKIIFFGFAFNPYDEAINNLLKNNIVESSEILIIDPDPNKKEINDLFSKSNLFFHNPIDKPDSIINKQIKSFLE